MPKNREPSTLGAVAVPSGLALIDGVMTVAAVAGPAGLLVAGGAVAGCGAAAAVAKRRKQKTAASKTVAGSAKRALSLGKAPKAGKASKGTGRPGKVGGGKSGRKGALGKMASVGTGKKTAATKATKGPAARGSMFGAGKSVGKNKGAAKTGRGKAGFGVSGRGLTRAGKASGKAGARPASNPGRAKKAAAAVRKGAKRAAKSRLFGKTVMALVSTSRFWKDRKPAAKPTEDAVDKRMRQLAKKKPRTKFAEPIAVELPAEPPPVALPSRIKPASTTQKGSPVSHQFDGAIEAVDAAFSSFDPENARKVEGYYAGIAELVASVSRGLQVGGVRITEDFPIDPGAGEYVSGLSQHMAALQEHIEEAAAAFKNAHADQLERINSGDSRQVKWDYAANQE